MSIFNLDELADSANDSTGNFLIDTANQAANFACGIYKDYPQWAIDPLNAATGINNPIAQFQKSLWDKLCSPPGRPGLPPPTQPPLFTGGQCPDVLYRVRVGSVNTELNPNGASTVPFEREQSLPGPITNFTYEYRGDSIGMRAELDCGFGHYNFAQDGGGPDWTKVAYVRVERLDGQPDNCGDEPGGTSYIAPPPEALTQNITVNQGDTNISFPVTFNSSTTINIPIKVVGTDPTSGNNFTINFDFDGVGFDFGGKTTPDSENINDIKDTTDETNNTTKETNNKLTETSEDVKKLIEALDLNLVGVINAQPCGKAVVEYKYSGKTFLGLQAQINSLANMLARVHEDICIISAKTTETDSALLEQLYDNVTTIGNNLSDLDKFLHSIGLDTLNNRVVTIVQIVSTLSNDNSNLELLEQLYDNVTSLNAFLRTIGLESLHNRIVTLSQIVSSGKGGSEANNDALEEILLRLGTSDFPITVPASIIETTDELGISIPIGTEVIESIPQFLVWLFHRADEVFGQWSIPIEIKDTDPTTPGDQSKIMKFPNMAEAMAELIQIALQLSINSELHSNLTTRILMEAGQDKQQNLITYHLLQSLTDYIGYSYKDKIVELPLLFDPTAASFDQMLTEVKIKVGVPEFDEKLNLQADLMRFRKAASILDSVYFRKIDTRGDIKSQLMERLFGLRDLLKDINPEDNSDSFKKFLEEVEKGFTSTPGVGDPTRPYGDDYENRPRFRDLTEEQNPGI